MIFLLFLPPGPESGSKWNFMCSWIRISIFRECRYEYLPYADSQHCLQVAVPRIFLKNSLPCLMKEARLFCKIIFSSVFRFSSLIFVFPPPLLVLPLSEWVVQPAAGGQERTKGTVEKYRFIPHFRHAALPLALNTE